VIAARSEDEASVFLDDDRYSDPGDAAAELLDALSAVPSLAPPEWPEASGEMDLVAGAEATPVSMEVGEPLGAGHPSAFGRFSEARVIRVRS
jgi:hypothetical protein